MSNEVEIVAASICRFNVKMDMDGRLAPEISSEVCEEKCDYCRIAAEYICEQLKEGKTNVC